MGVGGGDYLFLVEEIGLAKGTGKAGQFVGVLWDKWSPEQCLGVQGQR